MIQQALFGSFWSFKFWMLSVLFVEKEPDFAMSVPAISDKVLLCAIESSFFSIADMYEPSSLGLGSN